MLTEHLVTVCDLYTPTDDDPHHPYTPPPEAKRVGMYISMCRVGAADFVLFMESADGLFRANCPRPSYFALIKYLGGDSVRVHRKSGF